MLRRLFLAALFAAGGKVVYTVGAENGIRRERARTRGYMSSGRPASTLRSPPAGPAPGTGR